MSLHHLRQLLRSSEDEQWIKLDNFRDLLKSGKPGEDHLKNIKCSHIQKQAHIDTKTIRDSIYIKDESVLRYIFSHSHNVMVCGQLAKQITLLLHSNDQEWNAGRIELYNCLIKSSLFSGTNKAVIKLLDGAEVPLDHFSHDIIAYKNLFNKDDWEKICIFENNVVICHPNFNNKSPNEQDRIRWIFYEKCLTAKRLGDDLSLHYNAVLQHRKSRHHSTEINEGVQIFCDVPHLPTKIDTDIIAHVNEALGFEVKAVSVDSFGSKNAVIVFLEVPQPAYWQIITSSITKVLEEKHSVQCEKCVYLANGTLFNYLRRDSEVARFILYDDFIDGQLQLSTIKQCNAYNEGNYFPEQIICQECFPSNLPAPLSMSNFDLIKEWTFDVPLPVQLLLLSFVNKSSLTKSSQDDTFIRKKIQRLYLTFDTLLNTFNRNHTGLMQVANTDELLMHHSLFLLYSKLLGVPELQDLSAKLKSCF